MKIHLTDISFYLTIIITIDIIMPAINSNFHIIEAIRIQRNDFLGSTTRKPDYSDVYEQIDENDIFRNVRRIMRFGDSANAVPVMVPFKREMKYDGIENELGNIEHQTMNGLDQFITKSSLIYSNHEKFDFSVFWPKISLVSTHSSTDNYRVFYSNNTFIGCTMKGEADVQRTDVESGCYKLKDLRITLHFKNYEINVVTTSTAEDDKDIAQTAKYTLDRYIKQEYTLGLEKPAYDLEQKIKEYFGSYRCLIQEVVPTARPSRNNNGNNRNDRGFNSFNSFQDSTTTDSYNRPQSSGQNFYYTTERSRIPFDQNSNEQNNRKNQVTTSRSTQTTNYNQFENNSADNSNRRPSQDTSKIYFPEDSSRSTLNSNQNNGRRISTSRPTIRSYQTSTQSNQRTTTTRRSQQRIETGQRPSPFIPQSNYESQRRQTQNLTTTIRTTTNRSFYDYYDRLI